MILHEQISDGNGGIQELEVIVDGRRFVRYFPNDNEDVSCVIVEKDKSGKVHRCEKEIFGVCFFEADPTLFDQHVAELYLSQSA